MGLRSGGLEGYGGDAGGLEGAGADSEEDGEGHRVAGLDAAEGAGEIAFDGDALGSDGGDDHAAFDSGLFGRAAGSDLGNEHAGAGTDGEGAGEVGGQFLQTDSEFVEENSGE